MSNSSGPTHRSVANIRSPPPSSIPLGTASPSTPLRNISSAFGSPSALRAEEDCVVIELGARYLRVGFAGDAVPKTVLGYGPEQQIRTGNYKRWEAGFEKEWRKRVQGKEWGEAFELWRPDLRSLDLGLVGDKLDKAVREAFTKHLLVDSRPRRLVLVLPSALPLPLLSTILDILFTNFSPPTVSLLSAPALSTVAAGLRSALVVDIGWAETTISGIYEYREVQTSRSIRGMKMLGEAIFRMLGEAIDPIALQGEDGIKARERLKGLFSFEECEEVMIRMAWCSTGIRSKVISRGLTPVEEEDELGSSVRAMDLSGHGAADLEVSIPLKTTNPPMTLKLPFSKFATPCESALFGVGTLAQDLDDEELPLHLLVYRSLLKLPVDVRSVCMSRIIFVGGGSNLPGLKGRVLDEVATLIEQRGWDNVQGKAIDQYQDNLRLRRRRSKQAYEGPTEISQVLSAGLQGQEPDPIEDRLRREARKQAPSIETSNLRAIESLGAWSGGSLLSQLKIPAVSVVDRDQWIQNGASGASRGGEFNMSFQRQNMGSATFKSGTGERTSWTLGLWG